MSLTKEAKAERKLLREQRGLRQDRGTANARRGRGRRPEAHNGAGWGEAKTRRKNIRRGADELIDLIG